MVVKGIVRNGRVEVDTPPEWAEGTEVYLGLGDEESEELDWDQIPESVKPGTREEELAILREAYAEAKAGLGKPLDVAMAEIALEMGFPFSPKRG